MKKTIAFYAPSASLSESVFGSATLGFAGKSGKTESYEYDLQPHGIQINGEEPAGWLKRQKEELGIAETDFEHFTLSDTLGVNAHLSLSGQSVMSGRDLEPEMLIRYVRKEDVYKAVYDFYDDTEEAIVFGCAGLKGITGELPPVKSLGLYLFGEICMVGNQSVFGNLMLSKLKLIKK